METYYKNDLKRAYLILEGNEEEKEDYQAEMLRENEIPGILKTDVRYVDNQMKYYYDISGKTSFKMVHKKVNLSFQDMKRLVDDLLLTIQNLQKYMLDGNSLLLEPEFIFCDKENFYFCYYPFNKRDAREEFHKLTEFFVREVNYKDEEGVRFAYTLHKSTMEENYSIEEIMKQFAPKYEEISRDMMVVSVPDYRVQIEEADAEESRIEEKDDIWQPIRKFWNRAKQKYWGEDEEEE